MKQRLRDGQPVKWRNEQHEHNLSVGPCSGREASPSTAFWLMRENRQTSVLPKQKHLDVMDDLQRQEYYEPWRVWRRSGLAAWQTAVTQSVPPWKAVTSSPSYPGAKRMAQEIRRNKSCLYIYISMVSMGLHELRKNIGEWVGLVHLQNTRRSTCYYSSSLQSQR